jgi:hypothetical protein
MCDTTWLCAPRHTSPMSPVSLGAGRAILNLQPSTTLTVRGLVAVCVAVVLRRRGGRVPATARTGLIGQPRDPCGEEPPHPLVDIAATEPDRRRNGEDRHPVIQEDNPAPARMRCRDGRRLLPGQQRLPVRRREVDREGGCASGSCWIPGSFLTGVSETLTSFYKALEK